MSLRFLFFITLCTLTNIISSQNTFSKQYNFFDQNSQDAILDTEIYQDSIYMLVNHFCPEERTLCAGLVVSDNKGNIARQINMPWMYCSGLDNIIIKDDTVIISGHKNSTNDSELYLYKCNLQGDSINFKSYDIPEDIFSYNFGLEETDDHYVLYGDVQLINEDIVGYILWLYKNGNIDTLMLTPYNFEIVDSDIDNQGLLTILYGRNESSNSPFEIRGLKKFNSQKEVVWTWESPRREPGRIWYYSFTILGDNSVVFIEEAIDDVNSSGLWKVSPGGELEWVYNFNPMGFLKAPVIKRVIKSNSGDILVCGDHYEDYEGEGFLNGYVSKFNPAGEMLWERYYIKPKNGEGQDGVFRAMSEDESGNIIVGGYLQTDRVDSWLMLLDENGCYEPECTKRNILTKALHTNNDQVPCGIQLINTVSRNFIKVKVTESLIPQDLTYQIYNSSGQIQQSGRLHGNSNPMIHTRALRPGFYSVIFFTDYGTPLCSHKFIKH